MKSDKESQDFNKFCEEVMEYHQPGKLVTVRECESMYTHSHFIRYV